jgi:hypothetical protein
MYTHDYSNTQEQYNISAASNAFSQAYIAFQRSLSYSEPVTNNQTCERREKNVRGVGLKRNVHEREGCIVVNDYERYT